MQATELLRTLRAVRRFSARAISEVVLPDILEVTRWTGSAKNTQPWELVVVEDREALEPLPTPGRYVGHLVGTGCVLRRLGVPADRAVRTAISLGYPADAQGRRLSSAPADAQV